MDGFENSIRTLVSSLRDYSLLEFYHEEKDIKTTIKRLSDQLESFNVYLPKTKLVVEDFETAKA